MTKPTEIVNVACRCDNIDVVWDRRKLIKGIGIAVLTVQCMHLTGCATGNPPSDGREAIDNLIIQSGPGLLEHVHDLLIPYALLKAPPLRGVEFTTTQAIYHRHKIVLTQKDLIMVNQGGTVTQKASSHLFIIALANRQEHTHAG